MAYNVLVPVHLINAVSMAATITSRAQSIMNQDNVGIQLNWAGTPTGTFTVQVSNDHTELPLDPGVVATAGNWITLTLSTSITAAGSTDTAYIDLNQLSANWIRVVYTRSSGTGTLNCFLTAKGV